MSSSRFLRSCLPEFFCRVILGTGWCRLCHALVIAGLLFTPVLGRGADTIPGYVVLPLVLMGRANQATIHVAINGRPTMLILDTGASTLALDSAFYHGAIRQASPPASDQLPANLPHTVHGNGIQADVGSISSLTAGPMNFGGGPVVVTNLSGLFGQYNNMHGVGSVAGLLGEDVLHRYSAIIDWRRRGVYFNTNPAKRMKLGPALTAAGWTAVPMAATNAHRFTVPCTVSGKQVRLLVDTGAGFTSFAPGIVPLSIIYNRDTKSSMSHLASTGQENHMVGLDMEAYPAEVDHWKIGAYEIDSSYVSVHKFPPGSISDESSDPGPTLGLLGSEILAKNNALIDIAGSTLYLKAGSHPSGR